MPYDVEKARAKLQAAADLLNPPEVHVGDEFECVLGDEAHEGVVTRVEGDEIYVRIQGQDEGPVGFSRSAVYGWIQKRRVPTSWQRILAEE